MRDHKQSINPVADPGDREPAIRSLAAYEGADHGTETGRVHIGDAGQIQNDRLLVLQADQLLKVEEGLKRQRAVEFQDSGPGGGVQGIDFEWFCAGHQIILPWMNLRCVDPITFVDYV